MEIINKRLLSVDILRGITIIFMIIVNDPGSWSHVYSPLLHAEWNGITPTDYIFPTFLFIVGVSIVLSLSEKVENQISKKSILKKILYYVLTQISLIFSDLYTVTSKNDFEFIVKNYLFDKSKIKIRPNWVDSNPNMKFGNRENLRIVTVGRLVKQKNYEFLIKEFSDSNYTIDIIGDGPEKTKLENMAKTLNSNINFLGNLPHHELMNILSSTKYFISTSLYEGNSKVLLEALGAGCLVFATDIENNSEIITHEKTGILFDLNEGELINSFNKYIKDKTSGVISENAVSHISKNYSLSKVSDNEFSDYIWLLRQRG